MGLKFERNRIVGDAREAYSACVTADLGSAFGRTIGSGNVVVTGRDGKGFSRLMKRSFTCGVMENGIQILDTRLVPAPVLRFCVVESGSDYGVYIGFYWRDHMRLAATFFDRKGAILEEKMVRAILERRSKGGVALSPREVGDIMFYAEARRNYAAEVLRSVETQAISSWRPKVAVECSNGAVSLTLPEMLRRLECNVVSSHDNPSAYMTHKPIISDDSLMAEFAGKVSEEGAAIGIALDPCGESARFVDDEGVVITQSELGLLLVKRGDIKRVMLHPDMMQDSDRFRTLGAGVIDLSPSYERIMPPEVDLALGEDHTAYMRDDLRRWWDSVPVALRLIELASRGQKLSEMLAEFR